MTAKISSWDAQNLSLIPESGYRFSEKIMPAISLERDGESKKGITLLHLWPFSAIRDRPDRSLDHRFHVSSRPLGLTGRPGRQIDRARCPSRWRSAPASTVALVRHGGRAGSGSPTKKKTGPPGFELSAHASRLAVVGRQRHPGWTTN